MEPAELFLQRLIDERDRQRGQSQLPAVAPPVVPGPRPLPIGTTPRPLPLPLPVPVPQKNPIHQGFEAIGGLFGPSLPAGNRQAPQPPQIRSIGAPRPPVNFPTGGEIDLRKAALARRQLTSLGRPSSLVVPEQVPLDMNAPLVEGGGSLWDVLTGKAQPTEAASTPLESPGALGGVTRTLAIADKPREGQAQNIGEAAIQQQLGNASAGDLLTYGTMGELTHVNDWVAEDPERALEIYYNGYDVKNSRGQVIQHWKGENEEAGAGGRAVWEASRENLGGVARTLSDFLIDPTIVLPGAKAGGEAAQTVGKGLQGIPEATVGQKVGGKILELGGKGIATPSGLLDKASNIPGELAAGLGRTVWGKLTDEAQAGRVINDTWERLQAAIEARKGLPPPDQRGPQFTNPIPPGSRTGPRPVQQVYSGPQAAERWKRGLQKLHDTKLLPARTENVIQLPGPKQLVAGESATDNMLADRMRQTSEANLPEGVLPERNMTQTVAPPPIPGGRLRRKAKDGAWYVAQDVRYRDVVDAEGNTTVQSEVWDRGTGTWEVDAAFPVGPDMTETMARKLARDAADDRAKNADFIAPGNVKRPAPREMPESARLPASTVDEAVPPVQQALPEGPPTEAIPAPPDLGRPATPDVPSGPPSQPIPKPPKLDATVGPERLSKVPEGKKPRQRFGHMDALAGVPKAVRDNFFSEYMPKMEAWQEAVYQRYQLRQLPARVRDRSIALSTVKHIVDTQLPLIKKHAPAALIPDHQYRIGGKAVPKKLQWDNLQNRIEHAVFGGESYKQILEAFVKEGDAELAWDLVGARQRYRALRGLEPDDAEGVVRQAVERSEATLPSSTTISPDAMGISATSTGRARARENMRKLGESIQRNEAAAQGARPNAPETTVARRVISDLFGGIGTSDVDESVLSQPLRGDRSVAQSFLDRETDLGRLKELSSQATLNPAQKKELAALKKEYKDVVDDAAGLTDESITELAASITRQDINDLHRPAADPRFGGRKGRALQKAGRGFDKYNSYARGATLYNPVTGPRYIFRQAVDNAAILAQTGNHDVLFRAMNPKGIWRTYKEMRKNGEVQPGEYELLQRSRGRTKSSRISEAAVEQIERPGLIGEQAKSKWVRGLARLVSIPEIRDFANAIDTHTREQLFSVRYRQSLPQAKQDLIERSWRIAQENQVPGVSRQQIADAINAIENPGGSMSSADVQKALRELEGPPGIRAGKREDWVRRTSSEWKAIDDQLEQKAVKETERVLFSYEDTNVDAALRKVIQFHYWQTRSVPLYAQTFIQNPHLAAAYSRMMEKTQRVADDPNTPMAVRGFLKVMQGPGGWSIFMDPGAFGPFYLSVRDAAQRETGNAGALEQALDKVPFMFGPWAEAALQVIGARGESNMDPTFTRNQRDLVTQAWNYGRTKLSAWTGESAPEPIYAPVGEQGLVNIQNALMNMARGWVGSEQVDAPDKGRFAERNMREVLAEEVIKAEPNLSPGALQKRINQELEAKAGPIWDAAVANYTTREVFRAGPFKLSPANISTRFQPADDRRNVSDQIQRDADGMPLQDLTDEQRRAEAVQDIVSTDTARGRDTVIGQTEYNELYETNPEGSEAIQLWNDIAYDDSPEGITVPVRVVDGQLVAVPKGQEGSHIPAEILANATDDERKQFADMVMAATGQTAALQEIRDQRRDVLERNPETARWKDFQGEARNHPGGIMGFAEEMAKGNPAYRRHYEDLPPDMEWGSENHQSYLINRDGWLAAIGERGSIYDRTAGTPVTRDQEQIPYIPGQEGSGGSGDSGGSMTPADHIRDDIARYEEALIYANAAIRQELGRDIPYEQIAADPFGKQIADTALERAGVQKPYLAGEAVNYLDWVDAQPEGADISVERFLNERQVQRDQVLAGVGGS